MSLATPRLPEEVNRQGISVRKQSTNLLLVINVLSPNGTFDSLFLSNYAAINMTDVLARLPGVGQVTIFGERAYGMRMWLDAQRMASLGITTGDVVAAVREQNVQVAPGQIGAPPIDDQQQFQYTVRTPGSAVGRRRVPRHHRPRQPGRLQRPRRRHRQGRARRPELRLVRRARRPAVGQHRHLPAPRLQRPGGGAGRPAARSTGCRSSFPDDLDARILYDTTRFITASVEEVAITFLIAIGLVVFVTYVFLQDWRMTLIPSIAIPVSLIGSFAALLALGFTINTITLFGLILAIGIVVDDAIIVVENVQRKLTEGLPPREATITAMREVTGPIIATSLVLLAVFVPVGFFPGITGRVYQQFALTIAVAVAISTINALTLSPALCVSFLKPHRHPTRLRLPRLQRRLRPGARRLRPGRRRAGPPGAARPRRLRRAAGRDLRRLHPPARRLPAGGGPGLLLRQRPAPAGGLAAADHRHAEAREPDAAGDARASPTS